eukprot:UN05060
MTSIWKENKNNNIKNNMNINNINNNKDFNHNSTPSSTQQYNVLQSNNSYLSIITQYMNDIAKYSSVDYLLSFLKTPKIKDKND